MANLIITIIGIGLVAVAAIMGAYYGGTAFLNNTAQVHANTLLNEVHQIYAASTEYMLDHGLSNFGTDFSIIDVQTGGKYLPEMPPIAGIPPNLIAYGVEWDVTGNSPPPILDGEPVNMIRGICQINGKNVVGVDLGDTTGGGQGIDLSLSTSANLPIVKMILAINKTMGIPAGLTIAPSGLPYAADGGEAYAQTDPANEVVPACLYVTGTDKFNYCYLSGPFGASNTHVVNCMFTS